MLLNKKARAARRAGSGGEISLAKRRAWFDEQATGEPAAAAGSKYNPATVDDARKIIEALEKRIGEREATIDELKKASASLSDQVRAIQEANKKRLEAEGNFAELKTALQAEIETLRPTAERARALEAIIRESNEARINRVPETMRALIPAEYPPERLQAWLNANENLLTKPPAPAFDAGAGAGNGTLAASKLTPEMRATARKLGVTDDELLAEMKRREAEGAKDDGEL